MSIKDLYAHFKKSDHFQTLSKREQRNQNEGKFRKAIAKSNAYKTLYREAQKVRLDPARSLYNSKDGLINVEPVKEEDDVDVVSEGCASSSTQPAPKRARK